MYKYTRNKMAGTCILLVKVNEQGNSFFIYFVGLRLEPYCTTTVQQLTQCTNLLIYFASLPCMFRAYIQPIIKRLRVKCGNDDCLLKCRLSVGRDGAEPQFHIFKCVV
jgi:hypothetical protein